MKIAIQDHDKVITAFSHRDLVLVVTERGEVFRIKIEHDPVNDTIHPVCR